MKIGGEAQADTLFCVEITESHTMSGRKTVCKNGSRFFLMDGVDYKMWL